MYLDYNQGVLHYRPGCRNREVGGEVITKAFNSYLINGFARLKFFQSLFLVISKCLWELRF